LKNAHNNLHGEGVSQSGRSHHQWRRRPGKRSTPFQAEGSAGGHHQRNQTSLLLPEAWREAARQGRPCP